MSLSTVLKYKYEVLILVLNDISEGNMALLNLQHLSDSLSQINICTQEKYEEFIKSDVLSEDSLNS